MTFTSTLENRCMFIGNEIRTKYTSIDAKGNSIVAFKGVLTLSWEGTTGLYV